MAPSLIQNEFLPIYRDISHLYSPCISFIKYHPSAGKRCAITDYSFKSANNTLHLTRTATDDYPDTAVYYNVHEMSLKNCHIKPSVYDYYNISGGISMKKDPRPVDLTWRLAIEEMETKKYTNQENSDLLFSAILLAICSGDYAMAATAFTVKMTNNPMLKYGT
ncbi:hypothetical protein MAM1_0172d07189 [Mucor ambiguus]|uniref:Uncharacterized protein n=1 Tax=Mucor ambiguus TaxID=91626 RepID=A0A0C9MW01_9FUNG|nr:hypothetical protein MAM1_0172d07189 [Mucor ambiguus]